MKDFLYSEDAKGVHRPQNDVKDTKAAGEPSVENGELGKPYNIETNNKSFANYKPPRELMPDLKVLPKTQPQNKAATAIAALAQGEDTLEKKRHGFNKYNVSNHDEQPNAAFDGEQQSRL